MTSGDIAVLANPRAGRGRHRGLLSGVLQRLESAGHPVRLLEAAGAEEAEKACHRAVAEGCVALVAAGGDGTVHLALQAAAERPVAFGVVPMGTGNDFAVGVGVSLDPLVAAEGIAAALAAEVTEHARRWAGQDALRDEVEALGRPTVELPLLPGPMDVGSLFELAGRLEDHLRSEVAA